MEASEPGRFRVRLRNGHRLKAAGEGGPYPPGSKGRVVLSPHPRGGWRFVTGR